MTDKPKSDFVAVRRRLESIVAKYEGRGLNRNRDDEQGDYTLLGPPTEANRGRNLRFGGVQTRKNYVSYHLMPVYVFPDLLDGISDKLKKRMQGKSCFNFTRTDERLFQELGHLTDKGYRRFVKEKLIR